MGVKCSINKKLNKRKKFRAKLKRGKIHYTQSVQQINSHT